LLLRKIRRIVLENTDGKIVSLYVIGSFLSKEMTEFSDIDLIGVMKSSFDFTKEGRINKALNNSLGSRHRIDLGTMSYEEFFGGTRQGSVMKHIDLPIFLTFLKRARLLYGEKINFDNLPVKPASPKEELKYHVKVFDQYETQFRKRDRINHDFSFRDFIKVIFYVANVELQLSRGLTPRRNYSEIVKAFAKNKTHIVHHSLRLRHKRKISKKEKESWLNLADSYVGRMRAGDFKAQPDSLIMRAEILTNPSEVETAWYKQYDRLAEIFADLIGRKNRKIAEIGCGSGQLTIPLIKRAANRQFVLVDRFADTRTGSYSKNFKALVSNLKKARLKGRARIVVSDYLKWIEAQDDETFNAIVSSEFLPETDSAEVRYFMQACYRLLKPGGVTVHSFLSPIPRNYRQRLLIIADSNPVWTRTPPRAWFSPRPERVIRELRESGFQRIRGITIRSHLIMKAAAAKNSLKSWEVKTSFYEKHKTQLNKNGFEIPDWIIISGAKS
jgi:SAM-dependent methyltransferase/predicted nucleotidyltransferase